MPAEKISVLYPEWSTPQWKAISSILSRAGRATLELIPIEPERVAGELRRRAAGRNPPDLAMLPESAIDRCSPLPIASIHRFAAALEDQGALAVTDSGEAIGLRTFWAPNWFIGATQLNDHILEALRTAGLFKDPVLPRNLVENVQLLIHDQTLKLPKQLGGVQFDLHFPGILDIDMARDPANPNRAVLTVLGISGKIPFQLLPFNLSKLPWRTKDRVESGEGGFTLSLRREYHPNTNIGTVDFQTGRTELALSVRSTAPFLKRLGMDGIDVDIQESGRWDREAGTIYVDSGTITFAGGIFAGLQILLLASSKNEYRVETSQTSRWEPIEVEVVRLGDNPSDENGLLDRVRRIFRRLSSQGARLGYLISLAASTNSARDVYVTYGCVTTTVSQPQEKKNGEWVNVGTATTTEEVTKVLRRQLPDRDAILWYRGANPPRSDIEAALARNRPTSGCQ